MSITKKSIIKSQQYVVQTLEQAEPIADEPVREPRVAGRAIEDILFKLPLVSTPIIGTPKEVQRELDNIVIFIQTHPYSKKNEDNFNRIHVYMHGYLLNVVLKQFPYIRGYQTSDIYQESLIAIRFKAIPNFKKGKGMSFLNFAKMCIRRHLITLLNASQNRLKDKSMNQAISLDRVISDSDDEQGNTLSNIIPDSAPSVDVKTESNEALHVTKTTLMRSLSSFERTVLGEYLTGSSYKEIATMIVEDSKSDIPYDKAFKNALKAVDNALLRIRKKAVSIKDKHGNSDLPLFMK